MSIEKIKEYYESAHSVLNNSNGLYRQFREQFNEEKTKIDTNPNYSATGKKDLTQRLNDRKKAEFMLIAKSQKELFTSYLQEAQKLADSLAYQNVPKVDEVKKERFQKSFNELKTELLLTTNPRSAKDKLKEFIGKIDEYGLFEIVKNEFASLSESMIDKTPQSERGELTKDLRQMYDSVKHNSVPPESHEAYELLDQINMMLERPRIFSLIALDAIEKDLGREAKELANDPEIYFEKYPDEEKTKIGERTIEDVQAELNASVPKPKKEITVQSNKLVGRSLVPVETKHYVDAD